MIPIIIFIRDFCYAAGRILLKPVPLMLCRWFANLSISTFCFLFGAICESIPSAPADGKAFDFAAFDLRSFTEGYSPVYLFVFFAFVNCFHFIRRTFIERDGTAAKRTLTVMACIGLALLVTSVVQEARYPNSKAFNGWRIAMIYAPAIAYCLVNVLRVPGEKVHRSFENQVFFPVFFNCVTSVSIGIVAQHGIMPVDRLDTQWWGVDTNFKFCAVVLLAQLLQLLIFGFRESPRTRTYVHLGVPVFVIVVSTIANVWLDGTEGRFGIAIYAMVYALGLANSVRRLGDLLNGSDTEKLEGIMFYLPSINWAMAVIPMCTLLMPTMFKEMAFFPLIAYTVIVTAVWILGSNKSKTSPPRLFLYAYASSGLCICAFILSAGGFTIGSELIPRVRKVDTTFWLSSIFVAISTLAASMTMIRFMKDVLGVKLHSFYKHIGNIRAYYEFIGSFMLMLTVSFGFCTLNILSWFFTILIVPSRDLDKYYLQQRMTIGCIASIVAALIITAVLLVRRKVLVAAIEEADKAGAEYFDYAPIRGLGSTHVVHAEKIREGRSKLPGLEALKFQKAPTKDKGKENSKQDNSGRAASPLYFDFQI